MNQAIGLEKQTAANREKWVVALSSVLAAVLLTGIKLVVGITTGSLGILSEAAHSALDLVAAVVTFFAVRASARPADREHTYGHGKVENLSALFETFLLLATCVWIIYEAVERLFFKSVEVDINIWAFVVMIVSIVVDVSRSRALSRVAKKYQSQALEADALHFSTDIWSSCVVLFGLGMVLLSRRMNLPWLAEADSVAALGVAAIVIWVSYRLGRKTIADLLDAVSPSLRDDVLQAVQVPGVLNVSRVRVRRSGPEAFVDVTLCVSAATSLERGHAIADQAERAVHRIMSGADVVVHVEPVPFADAQPEENIHAVVRWMAEQEGYSAHDIHLQEVLGKTLLEFHLEVDERMDVAAAHALATEFEIALREKLPVLSEIVTHIEPGGCTEGSIDQAQDMEQQVHEVLNQAIGEDSGHCHPHDILVRQKDSDLFISFHCTVDPKTSITAAHDFTKHIERTLHARFPGLNRVVIHVEPPEETSTDA